MDEKLKPLFTPWRIGNCEIKNRIVLTSMGGTDPVSYTHLDVYKRQTVRRASLSLQSHSS